MSIPKYHEIFHVILICLNDDKIHGVNEVYDYCANSFHLTSEELAEKLTSGLGKFKNRVGWAKTYLAKAYRCIFSIT